MANTYDLKAAARIQELEAQLANAREEVAAQDRRRAAALSKWCDDFLERWWATHHVSIDVGNVTLPFGVKLDLIPDRVEKEIYRQSLKMIASALQELMHVPTDTD